MEYIGQENSKVPLTEMILNYKKIGVFPPIASFLRHSAFSAAVSCFNSRPWIEKGLIHFHTIRQRQCIYTKEEMEVKLGSYPSFDFQYRQVSNLVKILHQQYDLLKAIDTV